MIKTIGKIIISLIVAAIALMFMTASLRFEFLIPLFILSIFIIIIFAPSSKKKFFKIEAKLPTSKIRSVAMGLVEIKGSAKVIKPIKPKMGLKKNTKQSRCIGYQYTIDTISRGENGPDYDRIHTETHINDFTLSDDTGSIHISASDLEFVDFPIHIKKTKGNKRYQQSILMENNKVMIIGEAARVNQQVVIRREASNNIFSIARMDMIKEEKKMQPLYSSLALHAVIALALIAIVLFMDVSLDNQQLNISF